MEKLPTSERSAADRAADSCRCRSRFFFFRQVGENGINDQGIVDAGYHFDGACAAFTRRDVNIEQPLMGSING